MCGDTIGRRVDLNGDAGSTPVVVVPPTVTTTTTQSSSSCWAQPSAHLTAPAAPLCSLSSSAAISSLAPPAGARRAPAAAAAPWAPAPVAALPAAVPAAARRRRRVPASVAAQTRHPVQLNAIAVTDPIFLNHLRTAANVVMTCAAGRAPLTGASLIPPSKEALNMQSAAQAPPPDFCHRASF